MAKRNRGRLGRTGGFAPAGRRTAAPAGSGRPPTRATSAVPEEGAARGPKLTSAVPSYSSRLEQIAHLHLHEPEAEQLWRDVSRHRRDMLRRLGRDVGLRVALLDFLLNIRSQQVDATIIETAALGTIERLAISDALTGLYDRGYFEDALKRELERLHRHGSVSSLLLLDLDEFKEINDEYGHRVGDQVLRAFGDLMRRHVRGVDVPCRVGGDEFAIILTDTPQNDAFVVADRFRADVESWFEAHAVCGQFLGVTVSGGVATAPLDATAQESLFTCADRALYEAKRRGANRIATAADLATEPPPTAPAAA